MSFQNRSRLGSPPDRLCTLAMPLPTSPPELSRFARIAITWRVWRRRIEARRNLAAMDARSLTEMGISPAAAAYESGRPFWQPMGELR
jgi:uncharacterized protein YjiS (DUF1127 family)